MNRRKQLLQHVYAFSMIELMVVLAIACILLTLSIPNLRSLIQNQRMTATVNDFFAAINLTRSEAIRRGARVDLVPLDGFDWAKGWIVFIDDNNNQIPDAGEKVIFSHGPVSNGMIIKSVLTDSSTEYLAYNGTGRTRTNANGQTPQLGTISFFMDDRIRRIKLNFLGRARTCNPDNDTSCTGVVDAD